MTSSARTGSPVSAEPVRKVVNEAGLGNDPVKRGPRPHTPRRFERKLSNALWQIDIFTFDLKRFYKVYLIGIIDDHSRYTWWMAESPVLQGGGSCPATF